ncbi:MAG: VWA domain-containing protein [Pseudoclavibacter sp.]|nr:VWA domain-containing protein [Pseudoclavibacter sp.]
MALAYWYVTLGLLLLAVAVALLARLLPRRGGQGRVPVAHSNRLTGLASYRRALNRHTAALTLSAVVLGLLMTTTAVAAGRWIYQRVETPEKYNRDIVLCLDVSTSMLEYDVEVLDRYLEMLPGFSGERMALMLWDSSAVQVFPLTDDYDFVEEQLTEVRDSMQVEYGSFEYGTGNAPGASLVGDGLASCALLFDGQPDDGRSRSIILATDNQVHGDQLVSLPEAAAYAGSERIKVYGLDPNVAEDPFADEYRTSIVRNGGLYYKLADPQAVPGIVDQITSDQTSVVLGAPQLLIVDRPAGWLVAMLVGFALLLALGWRFRT